MKRRPKFHDHTIHLLHIETRSWIVTVDEDGDVDPGIDPGEVDDVDDSWLYCDTCGRLGDDELADHGISDEWQEV